MEEGIPIIDGIGGRRSIERGDTALNKYLGHYLMGSEREMKKAKDTIKKIHYMTLATSSRKAMPWCSPVFCAYDRKYNFYWISSRHCVHSANIKDTGRAALVVYDSTVPEGQGFGVYFEAKAGMVEDKAEIERALKLLYNRKRRPVPRAGIFVGQAARKVYRAVPVKVWINDIASKEEELKNIRTEIELK